MDKSGADRRIKLPRQTAALFEAQARDKLPAAPLLARQDGKALIEKHYGHLRADHAAKALAGLIL